ncbi:hypothetical protein GCM10018987_01830 [Streptomyces cremeus]
MHLGVGVLDAAERLVGQDDAEPEGVVGSAPLPDGDRTGRIEPLEQRGGVEPAGPAADDGDTERGGGGLGWGWGRGLGWVGGRRGWGGGGEGGRGPPEEVVTVSAPATSAPASP